jgi:hypothetical protein
MYIYKFIFQILNKKKLIIKNDSSVFGATFIVCGLIGATAMSLYVEKTHEFKKACLICTVLGFFGLGLFTGLSFLENLYAEIIAVACIGIFTMPLLPLSLDLGCELSFPIGEALSTGILMTGGNFVGII